jgi:DNA-binding transcriptional ArsR family regulator
MPQTKSRSATRSKRPDGSIDPQLVKAIAHPLRHRILVRLNQGTFSPNQMAQEFGERVGNVSYHVRVLADLGAIELIDTQPRRGATEHFYRATQRAWFAAADWSDLPLTTRRGIFGEYLSQIYADIANAADHHGFDDERAHVSYTPLELDDQGFDEVADALDELLERVLEIHGASANRAAAGDAELKRTEVVLLHFERGPGRGKAKRRKK